MSIVKHAKIADDRIAKKKAPVRTVPTELKPLWAELEGLKKILPGAAVEEADPSDMFDNMPV